MPIKRFLACIVATTALAVSQNSVADVSEAVHMLNGSETFSPIHESQVSIYLYKPNFQFKIIGTIEARGMAEGDLVDLLTLSQPTEKQDMELAVKALKREAASIGANGVIVIKQGQVRISSTATERRIVGAAIRY
jgi:hypothetical protein